MGPAHVISAHSDNSYDPAALPASVTRLAEQFGMPCVDLENHEVDLELLRGFPSQDLFRERILPLRRDGKRVTVAVADPLNLEALQDLTMRTGLYPDAVLAAEDQIQRHLKNALGVGGGTVQELVAMSKEEIDTLQAAAGDEIGDASQASSVVKLVNELIIEAVGMGASDIHIQPEEDDLEVRFFPDGTVEPTILRVSDARSNLLYLQFDRLTGRPVVRTTLQPLRS